MRHAVVSLFIQLVITPIDTLYLLPSCTYLSLLPPITGTGEAKVIRPENLAISINVLGALHILLSEDSDIDKIETVCDLAEIENLIGYHSLQEINSINLKQFGMAQHHRNMLDILLKLREHNLKEQSKADENLGAQ